LAEVLAAAVKQGDFAFKAGPVLYAHRVAGVKAARVVFVCAGDGRPRRCARRWRRAWRAQGGWRAPNLAVAVLGGPTLTDAHAEVLVAPWPTRCTSTARPSPVRPPDPSCAA
jgi:leucyl aminopeptidase